MKRLRFTNGPKKVLKRQYPSAAEVNKAINDESLWEKGTGINSLIPKNRKCKASGLNSLSKGYEADSNQDYMESYAAGLSNYNGLISKSQKNQIMFSKYESGSGSSFFLKGQTGHSILVDNFTYITGRAIVQVNEVGTREMFSCFLTFSAKKMNNVLTVLHHARTIEIDETGGIFDARILSNSGELAVQIIANDKVESLSTAFVEWIEVTKPE